MCMIYYRFHLENAGLRLQENQVRQSSSETTIATKYPNITTKYFREQGKSVDIVKLEGSVELAPLLGLQMILLILWKRAIR